MGDRLALAYGSGNVLFDPDAFDVLGVLQPKPGRSVAGQAVVDRALAEPIGAPRLSELAQQARTAAVLVSGRDRVTGADVFMPPLIRALATAGMSRDAITVFMATGTHIPFGAQDRRVILGPDFDPAIEVVGHDCGDPAVHIELGTTSFGNRVVVNRRAYECDLKILTGRITHHYFAGFTAGRKAVLPGVSALSTIQFNHRLVLSGTDGQARHPGARNGNLEGNPVHLDMVEALGMFGQTFTLNTAVGTDHRITDVFAGDTLQAHAAGCAVVAEEFEVPIERQATVAIASCGGSPYDCSFMQALKTLMNAHECVADGGVFLLLAQCPEGIKREFLCWEPDVPLPQLAETVMTNYDLTGHNTYLLREICRRIDVILVSDCPRDEVVRLGLLPAGSYEEGLALCRNRLGERRPTAYVIPFGNVTVVRR